MSEWRLIDSHCHLHDSEFFEQGQDDIYQQTIQAGIGMICVGTDQRSSTEAVEFAKGRPGVWVAVGVHPHDAKDGWAQIENLLKTGSQKIVAIGEIGLDYYYNHSPRQVQIQALEAQIQLALDYNLPISFHVREAFDDFWPVLNNFQGVRGVLHSFTDLRENLDKGLQRGFYIGLNGISTFTKDERQHELYKNIPIENILFETDAPFLTPRPFRGKLNMPVYVELVADYWADQRQIVPDELKKVATDNTRTLFGL